MLNYDQRKLYLDTSSIISLKLILWSDSLKFVTKLGTMEASKTEETELPFKMATLDIMEIDENNTKASEEKPDNPELTARVLRKRKSINPEITKSSNRRVSMKPRKHIIAENASRKQIEALYLNKKLNSSSQTLETIFEEPKTSNTTETLIGGRKLKRLLTFQLGNQYTQEKIKKRRAKIKKMLGNKSFLNRKKIPMPVFLKTIECLELDEDIVHTESVAKST